MSQPRREELLRYATRHSSWIIEDDYDGEFRYDTAPIPALRSLDSDERVLYVGSFSKTLFPGMRLGYLIAPPGLLEDLRRAKRYDDLGCGSIEQHALATFMHSGAFERHLRKVMLELRKRRAALIGAAAILSRGAHQRLPLGHAHGRVAAALHLSPTGCAAPCDPAAQPRRAPHPRLLLRWTGYTWFAAGRCELVGGTTAGLRATPRGSHPGSSDELTRITKLRRISSDAGCTPTARPRNRHARHCSSRPSERG